MSSLDDANPVERENAESPRILSQSVLDWASPDEERDNPGKLDGSGHPLASFSELRTQEANKKPGNWTVNHAIHVARWESYQAGNMKAFQPSSRDWLLLYTISKLKVMHQIHYCAKRGLHAGFAEASAKLISELDNATCRAVIALQNGGYSIFEGIKAHWDENFPEKHDFLAAHFSTPTGVLPNSLKKNLKKLGCSNYLEFDKKAPPSITKEAAQKPAAEADNEAETYVARIVNASLSKQMKLKNSSVQMILNEAIEQRCQESIASSVEKKRKRDDTIEGRIAALEKQRKFDYSTIESRVEAAVQGQAAPYEALLDDHMEILDHLVQGLTNFEGLAGKVKRLKERRARLKPATTQVPVFPQGEDVGNHTE